MYYIINIPGFLQVIDYARLFEVQSKKVNHLEQIRAKCEKR
jgi:hypothetical protein